MSNLMDRSPFDEDNGNDHPRHSRSPFDEVNGNDHPRHSRSLFDEVNGNDHPRHSRSPFDEDNDHPRHSRSPFDEDNDHPRHSRSPFDEVNSNDHPRHSRSLFDEVNGNDHPRHSRSPFDEDNDHLRHSRSPFNEDNDHPGHSRSPFDEGNGNDHPRHSRSPFNEDNDHPRHPRHPFDEDTGNDHPRHSRHLFDEDTGNDHPRHLFDEDTANDHPRHSRSPFDEGNGNDHPRHSRSPFDEDTGNGHPRHPRHPFDEDTGNEHPRHSRSPFDEGNGNYHPRHSRSPFDEDTGNDHPRHPRHLFDEDTGNDHPRHSRSPFDEGNGNDHPRHPFDEDNGNDHPRHPRHSRSLFDSHSEPHYSRSPFEGNNETHHLRSPFEGNNDLIHPMFNLQRSSSPNRNRNHGSSSPRRINPFEMNHESRYESLSGNFFLPQMNPQNLQFHQSQTSPPPPNSYSWNPNVNVRYPHGQSHPQNPVQTSARGERQDFSLRIPVPVPVMYSDNSMFPFGSICQNKAELDRRIRNFPDLPKEAHMKIMEMGNQILEYFDCQLAWFEDNGSMKESTKSHVLFVRKERTGQSWLMAFTPFKGRYILSYNRLITQKIHCAALSSTAVELEPSWSKKNTPREQCVFNFPISKEASKFMKSINDLKQNTWDLEEVETERRRHDILRASSEAQLARLAQSPPLMEEHLEIPMPRLLSLPHSHPHLHPRSHPRPRPPSPPPPPSQPRRREERRSIFPDPGQTISNQHFPREFSSPVQNSGMGLRNVFSGNIYNTGSNGPSYAEVCGGGNSARRSFCQSSAQVKYMETFRECQVMRSVRESRGGRGSFEIQCRKLFSASVKLFVKKIVRSFDDECDYREIATGTIVVQEKENELFREVCFYDGDGKLAMCHCIYGWNYIDLFSNSPLGTQKTYLTCIWNGQSFLSIVPSPYPVIREFKGVFNRSIDASEFVLAFLDGVNRGKDLVEGKMQAAAAAQLNMDSDSNSNHEHEHEPSSVSNWFN